MKKLISTTQIGYIYEKYFDDLMFWGYNYTSNYQNIEDAINYVFQKIINNTIPLPQQSKELKSYLYISVRNRIFKIKKEYETKLNNQISYEQNNEESSIEDQIIENEIKAELYLQIENLPPRCKEVILLSLKKMDRKQIAKELNLSEETVKSQKKLAMQKLKKEMVKKILLLYCDFFS